MLPESAAAPETAPATPELDPELVRRRQIVQRIIDYFGTQESLASQPEVGVDQSAVSLWLRRGRIPSERMDQIMAASQRLVREGTRTREIVPSDFFAFPEEQAIAGWSGVICG